MSKPLQIRAETILELLRQHRAELEAQGIAHASLFGSVARGDATAHSDIDILLDFKPERRRFGFAHFGQIEDIRTRLAELFGRDVDIAVLPIEKPRLRAEVERERLDAF